MIGKVFFAMITFSFISAAFTGRLDVMGNAIASSAADTVNLCISLCGMMCFWSGIMNVMSDAGILKKLSKVLYPILKLIYGKSNVKDESIEKLSASVSANFLGLGNAALPIGINAVQSLEKNNKTGVASDSTIMFAVLNTVPFQLIPSTLIALRSKYGSINPFDVVPYIWLCSFVITVFAVLVCKLFAKVWR